jgi:hypothetical protein
VQDNPLLGPFGAGFLVCYLLGLLVIGWIVKRLSRGLFPSPSLSADHLPSLQLPPSPQPSPARSRTFLPRAEGEPRTGPPAHDRSRISFVATKMAHRSLSANPVFPVEPHRHTLVSGELTNSMVLERAAPVGFAGRVPRREFGVDSRPGGTATDSAPFPCVGNLRV